MWAIAVYDFRLSDEQFWKLTPAQFWALSRRHDHAVRHGDLHAGIIASTVANCNRDPKRKKEPFSPRDFMPSYGDEKPEGAGGGMSPEQILEFMKAAFPKGKKGRRGARG